MYDETTDDVAPHFYAVLKDVGQDSSAARANSETTGYANVAESSEGNVAAPQYVNTAEAGNDRPVSSAYQNTG